MVWFLKIIFMKVNTDITLSFFTTELIKQLDNLRGLFQAYTVWHGGITMEATLREREGLDSKSTQHPLSTSSPSWATIRLSNFARTPLVTSTGVLCWTSHGGWRKRGALFFFNRIEPNDICTGDNGNGFVTLKFL